MKHCVQCGKQIDDHAPSCGFCGAVQPVMQPQYGSQGVYGTQREVRTVQLPAMGMDLIFDIVKIVGLLLIFLGTFVALRRVSGSARELAEIEEYIRMRYSMFSVNAFIGLLTMLLALAGIAVILADRFVTKLGIVKLAVPAASAVWTFLAIWIARALVPGRIVKSMVKAISEDWGIEYSLTADEMKDAKEEIVPLLKNGGGFWLLLLGVLIVIAGIVLGILMGGEMSRLNMGVAAARPGGAARGGYGRAPRGYAQRQDGYGHPQGYAQAPQQPQDGYGQPQGYAQPPQDGYGQPPQE